MTDFMEWLSIHYIKPYADSQPRDMGEEAHFSVVRNDLPPELWESPDAITAFYAVQGFRLGLKTGPALVDDLRG